MKQNTKQLQWQPSAAPQWAKSWLNPKVLLLLVSQTWGVHQHCSKLRLLKFAGYTFPALQACCMQASPHGWKQQMIASAPTYNTLSSWWDTGPSRHGCKAEVLLSVKTLGSSTKECAWMHSACSSAQKPKTQAVLVLTQADEQMWSCCRQQWSPCIDTAGNGKANSI